jgi:uncharacterized protein YndB with AHSA1/START domain
MASPAPTAVATSDKDRTLEITRSFDAPREAVFAAWTDPAQLLRWLGPGDIKVEITEIAVRSGGAYRYAMHGTPNGTSYVRGVYREVTAPERLVFTWAWEDAATCSTGTETVVTVTFRAKGTATEMILRQEIFDTQESRDSHNYGWSSCFEKLAALFANAPQRT